MRFCSARGEFILSFPMARAFENFTNIFLPDRMVRLLGFFLHSFESLLVLLLIGVVGGDPNCDVASLPMLALPGGFSCKVSSYG